MSRTCKILVCAAAFVILASLPGSKITASRTLSGDLNENGTPEHYLLAGHRLTVRENDTVLWQSSPAWRITDFALGDADNDGTVNLLLSLWKKGSFGPVKPFWIDGEDQSYKNHLFVYRLHGNTMQPVWCSSDLDRPIVSFTVRDINGDGMNELVVQEGHYRRTASGIYTVDKNKPTGTAFLKWNEWGFAVLRAQDDGFRCSCSDSWHKYI